MIPTSSETIAALQKQNHELKVMIGVLVERLGGDVLVTFEEMSVGREIGNEVIGLTGSVRLTAKRP
jgi:hypothetical protein